MDTQFGLSKEHECKRSDADSGIFQVKYLDTKNFDDFEQLLITYGSEVLGEDFNAIQEINGIEFSKAELHMAKLEYEGAKIRVAVVEDLPIGMMIYHTLADCILYIRGLYVMPEMETGQIGSGFIDSFPMLVKKVIFQTSKSKKPDRCLSVTSKYATPIHETEFSITWEMGWGYGRRS